MVLEHRHEHPSQWVVVESIAGKIGCLPQKLRNWVRQHEVDAGQREGVSTAEGQRIKDLEREVHELRKANENLKLAERHHEPSDTGVPAEGAGWLGHRQGDGLQPSPLGGAHALPCSPRLPIDNNFDEQQIRPWATARKNWLFAGTLLAGQRAAAIMSLIQTAKVNGHDPYAYLRDVLTRLPTQRARDLAELLPSRWVPLSPQ
jgi:hypothetical protein